MNTPLHGPHIGGDDRIMFHHISGTGARPRGGSLRASTVAPTQVGIKPSLDSLTPAPARRRGPGRLGAGPGAPRASDPGKSLASPGIRHQ